MNKLDQFFKEEIDYEDFQDSVEEDEDLDFAVGENTPSTDDAVSSDSESDENRFDIDSIIMDDEEEDTLKDNESGYEQEQPVEESTIILF